MDESDGDKLKRVGIILLMGLLIGGAKQVHAVAVGGFTGTFMRLTPDGLSAGLGGITLFDNASGYAFMHNPASLMEAKRRIHAGTVNLSLDRHFYGINLTMPLPPTAHIGMGVLSAGTKNIPGRDSRGFYTGELQDEERLIGVSFANDFSPKVSVGIALQIVQRTMTGAQNTWDLKASGFGIGAGAMLKITPATAISIAAKNLKLKYNWNTQALFTSGQGQTYTEEFPQVVALGLRHSEGALQLLVEIDDYLNQAEFQYRAGLVFSGWQNLTLRGGAQYVDSTILPGFSASYQLPLEFGPAMQIDLGMVIGVPGEGVRQYLSWEMEF